MGGRGRTCLMLGGWLTVVTGAIHGLLTIIDCFAPTFLIPTDPAMLAAMHSTSLELVAMARDSTTVWRAWVGFNLAFAIGACVFGAVCIDAGQRDRRPFARLGVPLVSVSYAVIAILCWFYAPAIAFSIAALLVCWGTWRQRAA
jgi:hypothetical protein